MHSTLIVLREWVWASTARSQASGPTGRHGRQTGQRGFGSGLLLTGSGSNLSGQTGSGSNLSGQTRSGSNLSGQTGSGSASRSLFSSFSVPLLGLKPDPDPDPKKFENRIRIRIQRNLKTGSGSATLESGRSAASRWSWQISGPAWPDVGYAIPTELGETAGHRK